MPEIQFTDQSFNYLFVGMVPVLLFALVRNCRRRGCSRRGRLLMTGVMIAALLYMLGRYTPAFAFAYEWIPGVDLFRRPVDAGFVFIAAFALLCGYLLSDFVREGLPRISLWRALPLRAASPPSASGRSWCRATWSRDAAPSSRCWRQAMF